MATYHAIIPPEFSARQVFEAVEAEVLCAMEGVCVVAQGDARMGRYFSVTDDEVFKACTDQAEIFRKISEGASIGTLFVRGDGWSVRVCRHYPRAIVDDKSVPRREHYSVRVMLISHPCFGDVAGTKQEYDRWLESLEEPEEANRITESWGETKDVMMSYRIHFSKVPGFLRHLGVSDLPGVEAYGEVRELEEITPFAVDLSRYGFGGLYSVYPEWPTHGITNYPIQAFNRFCALVDTPDSGILVSVGRRHCAFRCKQGTSTRTLEGNRFDVYRTKTRRSIGVSFDRYADEDPPVREFSGGVRNRLASLGIRI